MLFELLSRQSQTTHPAFLGYERSRQYCDPAVCHPIWYGYHHTPTTDMNPAVRHPTAGLPRDWVSKEDIDIDAEQGGDDESESDDEEEEEKEETNQKRRTEELTSQHQNSSKTHPVCWNLSRAKFRAHPVFAHRPLQTLTRMSCQTSNITPAVYNYTLIRKVLPEPLLDRPFKVPESATQRQPVLVKLPKGPIECPVCKGQPGRLGRSGCPACWRNPQTLPWTFPARTMPGVEQGYSVSNLQFQSMLRIRKRGDERVARAKNTRQELPSISGKSMQFGDLEKDRATADLCTHTPFYSRPALALHRAKHESDMLRIIIRNLPDDGVLVDLVVCPHVVTLAHLNLLYVANTNDTTAGLCLEGRVSPLVLLVPTEDGVYHIDLRVENTTDLHGFYNFSPGSSTVLSELRFGNTIIRAGKVPDTLLLLRVPVLSNIAVRQLMTCFLSVNTSMKIDQNSRSVRLLRNKMFEIPRTLPGNDCIQQYMTPLMLRKRDLKMQIAAQVRAEEKAVEEQEFRVARAEQQQRWKKARREKNRQLLLKRQAAELAEKRRLDLERQALKKANLQKITEKRKREAQAAMILLRRT
jgi:hypothetical protein